MQNQQVHQNPDFKPLSSLEPIQRQSVTEAVIQRLIELIKNGSLKPGDRLPPERDIAIMLDVSRTTLREALKLLTLSGILEARRGYGTRIRKDYSSFVARQIAWPALLNANDFDEVYQVREALEVLSARLAALRATPEEIEAITVYRELAALVTRDVEKETQIDLAFHRAIAVASHNTLLSQLMLALRDIVRDYIIGSYHEGDSAPASPSGHEAVYVAIAARDAEAAAAAMAAHLEISRQLVVSVAARGRGGDKPPTDRT